MADQPERGGDPAPTGDTVDERTGLLNVINVLHARVPDAVPAVTFRHTGTGRYRIEFDFSPRVTTILKETVPAAVRRWRRGAKHWEISADWVGPLVAAFRNAGYDGSRTGGVAVRGLSELEETAATWWCLGPMLIGKAGHRAYLLEGRCVICTRRPHRAGDLACEKCHGVRLVRVRRVHDVLASKGLLPWPTATPSAGAALRCCYPLLADVDTDAGDGIPDYAAAVDATILAGRGDVDKPPCPVCRRRPAKGAVIHVACRRRVLALLSGKPFSKPVNRVYQAGSCVCCAARGHSPGAVTCDHCQGLVLEIKKQSQTAAGE